MIVDIEERECFELLRATTVGRLGFVHDEAVQIIPVNYRTDGQDLIIRTSPDGILSTLEDHPVALALQVDHHDDLGGAGWSVLMNGSVTSITDDADIPGANRVLPWSGGERGLALRFVVQRISGRRVRRER